MKDVISDYSNIFEFSVIENKYVKITYKRNKPINVMISQKLIGGEILHASKFTFLTKNHWFTPQINYKGCTHISFHNLDTNEHIIDWLLPNEITQGVNKQKIICVGLNKTGTTSFEKDLKSFGFRFPPTTHGTLRVTADIYHNSYHSLFQMLDSPKFDAYQDLPFSLPKVYQKMYKYRPNDIYVLTIRKNPQSWVKSVLNHYSWLLNSKNPKGGNEIFNYFSGPELIRYSNFNVPLFYFWGLNSFDDLEKTLLNTYEQHNNEVVDFFERNKSNFKVIDVSKENELKTLTDWLGIDNTRNNFCWENRRL